MRVLISGGLAIAATVGGLIVVGPMRSEAKDYGQAAQAFPVIEPDLLSTGNGNSRPLKVVRPGCRSKSETASLDAIQCASP